jgi:hypothetical protein
VEVAGRVDDTGAAYAGSQLQTQLWINHRPADLSAAVAGAFEDLDGSKTEWVSPLRADAYREYQDAAFLRAVRLEHLGSSLKAFWPRGGPVWDGLGIVKADDASGVILLEGKSYPGELYGSGCQASPSSRTKIEAALATTQAWLGVQHGPDVWCGSLYQTANRLAHLYWLNEVAHVDAWLVHLLFTGDPRTPTTAEDWQTALRAADEELGLPAKVPRAGHVILPAGTRDELLRDV